MTAPPFDPKKQLEIVPVERTPSKTEQEDAFWKQAVDLSIDELMRRVRKNIPQVN